MGVSEGLLGTHGGGGHAPQVCDHVPMWLSGRGGAGPGAHAGDGGDRGWVSASLGMLWGHGAGVGDTVVALGTWWWHWGHGAGAGATVPAHHPSPHRADSRAAFIPLLCYSCRLTFKEMVRHQG